VSADDIFDMDAKLEAANKRDDELARILINEHVYKEDVDESTLEVKTDGAAKRLTSNKEIPYPETNAQGTKRQRWKYVAKVVNTRSMRKKGRRLTSYTNNNMENTLVEEDGELRVATVEEAKQVAWKPTRTKGTEYIYEGALRAWLEKTIKGKTDVWGSAPKQSAAEAVMSDKKESKFNDGDAESSAVGAGTEENGAVVAISGVSDEEITAARRDGDLSQEEGVEKSQGIKESAEKKPTTIE
jgi:hypothetical protein